MLINASLMMLYVVAGCIAFVVLFLIAATKMKLKSEAWGGLGIFIAVIAGVWFYAFNCRNVYIVTGSVSHVEVEHCMIIGGNFDAQLNGSLQHYYSAANNCIIVNKSSTPLYLETATYDSYTSPYSTEQPDRDHINVASPDVEVLPMPRIDYMPGEEFPESITQQYSGKSKKWGLRIGN